MTNFELFLRATIVGAGFTVGAIGVVFVGLIFAAVIGGIFQESKK